MSSRILLIVIVIGIILLAYNQPILSDRTIHVTSFLMRSDSIFTFAAFYGLALIILKKLKAYKNSHGVLITLVFVYVLGLVSTILNLGRNGAGVSAVGLSKILKIPVCLLFCWILYLLLRNNRSAIVTVSKAMYLSATISVFIGILGLSFPNIMNLLGNLREDAIGTNSVTTFSGLTPNPWFIAYSLIISACFTWAKVISSAYEKRYGETVLFGLYSILLILVMVMTEIRSTIFLLPISMLLNLYLYNKYVFKRAKKIVLYAPIALIVLLGIFQISWLILPSSNRASFFLRFKEESLRPSLYQYYLNLGKNNPIGLGYDYLDLAPYEMYKAPVDIIAPHNAVLSILTISGYFGVVLLLFYFVRIRKVLAVKLNNISRRGGNRVYFLGAITAFACSWLVFLVTEIFPLSDFSHYILLAILMSA